jgi:hypothetical protein
VDFHFIQALHETRELADDHGDEPGWADLRQQVDRLLDRLTEDAGDPTTEAIRAQRIDRNAIPAEEAKVAIAALMAIHDRPDDEQLELARDAVQELEDALG